VSREFVHDLMAGMIGAREGPLLPAPASQRLREIAGLAQSRPTKQDRPDDKQPEPMTRLVR